MFDFLDGPHKVSSFDLPFFIPASKISSPWLLYFLTIISSIFTCPESFHLDTKLPESSVFLPVLEVMQVILIVHVASLTVHYKC